MSILGDNIQAPTPNYETPTPLTEEHFSHFSLKRRTSYRTDDKKFCESLERHLSETKQEIERLRVALNGAVKAGEGLASICQQHERRSCELARGLMEALDSIESLCRFARVSQYTGWYSLVSEEKKRIAELRKLVDQESE